MDYISPVANVCMVLIWLVYLQIFLFQYKRANRPLMVIHHAQGSDPDAACMLVNMSQEPVHVLSVMAKVTTQDKSYVLPVTEYQRLTVDDQNVQGRLRQGPLQSGEYLLLGTFEEIILGERSKESGQAGDLRQATRLELRIAAVHGPSRYHIGARRHFRIETGNGKPCIIPEGLYTEQLASRRSRKLVQRWVEEQISPVSANQRDPETTG